jgi:hypothetical protein
MLTENAFQPLADRQQAGRLAAFGSCAERMVEVDDDERLTVPTVKLGWVRYIFTVFLLLKCVTLLIALMASLIFFIYINYNIP